MLPKVKKNTFGQPCAASARPKVHTHADFGLWPRTYSLTLKDLEMLLPGVSEIEFLAVTTWCESFCFCTD